VSGTLWYYASLILNTEMLSSFLHGYIYIGFFIGMASGVVGATVLIVIIIMCVYRVWCKPKKHPKKSTR